MPHESPPFVFFGTPEIARLVLTILLDHGFIPSAIVTNPDRPAGRKKVLTPPPVKELIAERGLAVEVLQPEKLSEVREKLLSLEPAFFVVAAYGKIIPKSILEIPRLGTIGVHPSLLPNYRGPSPIQTAILEGATETGVSLYLIDEKMDEGPILAQEKFANYRPGAQSDAELSHDLALQGGEMLARLIPRFVRGEVIPKPQDHPKATYTKKFSTDDAFVAPEDLEAATRGGDAAQARAIHQKILAFTPEPGAWTMKDGVRIKLLASEIKDGALVIKKIQRGGKMPQEVKGF